MKTTLAIKIAASAAICLATLSAAPAFAADLTVNLQGLRAQTGLVKVALVDSQQAWDGKAAPVQATGAPPQALKINAHTSAVVIMCAFIFINKFPFSKSVPGTHGPQTRGTRRTPGHPSKQRITLETLCEQLLSKWK